MTTTMMIVIALLVLLVGMVFSINYLCNKISSLEERVDDLDSNFSEKIINLTENTAEGLILTGDRFNSQLEFNNKALDIMRQNATEGGTHELIEELKGKPIK